MFKRKVRMSSGKLANFKKKVLTAKAARNSGETQHAQILQDALIDNYDDMKNEFEELDDNEKQEFLTLLGDNLKDNFQEGPDSLGMELSNLEDSECETIVNGLISFLDRHG